MNPRDTLNVHCPHCDQRVDLRRPGDYAPRHGACGACGKPFIYEPTLRGARTYKPHEAPCNSDPDCLETEMMAGDD